MVAGMGSHGRHRWQEPAFSHSRIVRWYAHQEGCARRAVLSRLAVSRRCSPVRRSSAGTR
eukprot:5033114-Prymnesium_polylepis.1